MAGQDGVHRDALSAWRGLVRVAGMEPDGRDEDLGREVQRRLDGNATTLSEALRNARVDDLVQALFQAIQPFPLMFADVLRFFERAREREGQTQLRLALEGELPGLRHFEEFLEQWRDLRCVVDVPAIDASGAWLPGEAWDVLDDAQHLGRRVKSGETCGIVDVDAWLARYDRGTYGPYPASLLPDRLPRGLADAGSIVVAALDVIRRRWPDQDDVLARGRTDRPLSEPRDGLDVGTIAQNEADRWLRQTVLFIGRSMVLGEVERDRVADALAAYYEPLGRRQIGAQIGVADLERILSLPAWRKRYELFGVWVATEMLASLDGHDVAVNCMDGELRFGFGEARIADVRSSRPPVALYAERRTSLDQPVGEGRIRSVQPDFGLWAEGREPGRCAVVVEVKHYKRRDMRNFTDALTDYARAHPMATVGLVNYGPVGSLDVPADVARRCWTVEWLNPQVPNARDVFRERVRDRVGEPVRSLDSWLEEGPLPCVAVDVSLSMMATLKSWWFERFVESLALRGVRELVLVDTKILAKVPVTGVSVWLRENHGGMTLLGETIGRLAADDGWVLVVTDEEGVSTLGDVVAAPIETPGDGDLGVRMLAVRGVSV